MESIIQYVAFCVWLLSVFVRFIHVASVSAYFYGQIIFRCMGILHFANPFLSWWTFGLYLFCGYCVSMWLLWIMLPYSCMYFGVAICFQHSWMYSQELLNLILTLFSFFHKLLDFFPQWLCLQYISVSKVWGFQFFCRAPQHLFLSYIFDCSHHSRYEEVSHYGFDLYFHNG